MSRTPRNRPRSEPARSISTRITAVLPNTVTNRAMAACSRWRYGAVLDPLVAVGQHGKVTRTYALTELGVRGWKSLDPGLKSLAVMAASVSIGCTWCVDFGYWEAQHEHVDPAKLHDVPAWRTSERFTGLERDVPVRPTRGPRPRSSARGGRAGAPPRPGCSARRPRRARPACAGRGMRHR